MDDLARQRRQMVEAQLAGRGIRDSRVLRAMGSVPREDFLPESLREFAYEDSPLPIEEGQTISQPFIVAYMTEALKLEGGERVLEIGTGSGYAAAVLAEIAGEVFTVERFGGLAETARRRLAEQGYENVAVIHGDGTLGLPERAPFDAIVVAAGGPELPPSLRRQLSIGGRMVIPVGADLRTQNLVRVTRVGPDEYRQEELGAVRFVPLVGREGWKDAAGAPAAACDIRTLPQMIAQEVQSFSCIEEADVEPLLARIGDARVVLLGEATHGTSEFYRMRARITQELIIHKGFNIVAAEADWPDAARIDHYVRHLEHPPGEWMAFTRFPTWMWRNQEMQSFVEWLRVFNRSLPDAEVRVGFYGLDLYNMFTSIQAVLRYLDRVDPETAQVARERYGCLTPWQNEPAVYGRAALTGRYRECERPVTNMLTDLLSKQVEYAARDGEQWHDAVQNARLVSSAERYYRVMYYGSRESWNLRDSHMFQTLASLLAWRGPTAKAVVWEHNSHVGNAAATEMSARGEHNVGQMCREEFGPQAYLVGFGTDRGTVAAASEWDGPMDVKEVRPAHPGSYEHVFHRSGVKSFLLPLRRPASDELRRHLMPPRLERAIGVIYRPESELTSHYFQAILPEQFDEYVWLDRTSAVHPLETAEVAGLPETYPFGL